MSICSQNKINGYGNIKIIANYGAIPRMKSMIFRLLVMTKRKIKLKINEGSSKVHEKKCVL